MKVGSWATSILTSRSAPLAVLAWLRRGMLSAERGVRRARLGNSPLAEFAAANSDYQRTLELPAPRRRADRARALAAGARGVLAAQRCARKAAADREQARKSIDQAVAINPHYAHRRGQLFAGL